MLAGVEGRCAMESIHLFQLLSAFPKSVLTRITFHNIHYSLNLVAFGSLSLHINKFVDVSTNHIFCCFWQRINPGLGGPSTLMHVPLKSNKWCFSLWAQECYKGWVFLPPSLTGMESTGPCTVRRLHGDIPEWFTWFNAA